MAKKKKKADEKPKKKTRAREEQDEDEEFEEEEYSPSAAGKPRLDIYVGLSSLTLIILVAAAVFFYLDASEAKTPPAVALTIGGLQPAAQPGN